MEDHLWKAIAALALACAALIANAVRDFLKHKNGNDGVGRRVASEVNPLRVEIARLRVEMENKFRTELAPSDREIVRLRDRVHELAQVVAQASARSELVKEMVESVETRIARLEDRRSR